MGIDAAVIEANSRLNNRERGRCGGDGLSMIATYNQVENYLGIHLRYL